MDQEFFLPAALLPGSIGQETNIQKTAAAYMEGFADEVRREVNGNVTGILNPDSSFKILLAGHIDEIDLWSRTIQKKVFCGQPEWGELPRGCIWDRRCGLTRERTWYTGGSGKFRGIAEKGRIVWIQTLLSTLGPETGSGQKACACGVRCGV